MQTTVKTVLSLVVLAALTTIARADDTKADSKAPEKKGIEAKSPWSVDTTDRSDGYFGTSSTKVMRDMGDGWAVGGKMTTPYQDQKIGGGGPPGGLHQFETPKSNTLFGPVLEKKF